MNQNTFSLHQATTGQMFGLMLFAYLFSFAIRMIWVFQFQDNPSFLWNNELMINTNDGYFFASGVQQALEGLHTENPRVFGLWDYGVIFFTTLLAKITPFSLETILLYMPAFISSLVVIPIILIARLYKLTLIGFFAALVGSIAWSYYNRTMIGYYDTDMFAAMAPMFILFFLLATIETLNLKNAFYATLFIIIYPFLYDQGLSILYAMALLYAFYMFFFHIKERITYTSLILIFSALMPLPLVSAPLSYLVKIMILAILYFVFKKELLTQRALQITTLLVVGVFLFYSHFFDLVWGKIVGYAVRGVEQEGLHFYQVNQTVREAGKILFFPVADGAPYQANIAHRMVGSSVGLIAALIGYVLLVMRHKAFILALPLIGIGIFAHWGGLRFTIYAVPIAALSAIYLFWFIAEKNIKSSIVQYSVVFSAAIALLYPNIKHIIDYKVPTVFTKQEVDVLNQLNNIASTKDYTLAWWDYGYPIWYYSDTNTLIDGGKHNHDNFIISKILTTNSPQQAANLARLSVETYVDSNYSIVSDTLFKKTVPPQRLFSALREKDFKVPPSTRDIYLYMPNKMMRILPTVSLFSNIDLSTGKKQTNPFFYVSSQVRPNGSLLQLGSNIAIDTNKAMIYLGNKQIPINTFIHVQYDKEMKIQKREQVINKQSPLYVIYMQSYQTYLVLDITMYQSLFIQMFVLENYDDTLFEPIIMSPYAKVYKVTK